MLVDSGSKRRILDRELIPGLQNQMNDCQELRETHEIVAAEHHTLKAIDTGTIKGTGTDQGGKQHHVKLSGTIVPGLG